MSDTNTFDPTSLDGYLLVRILDVNSGSVDLTNVEDGTTTKVICGVISIEARNSSTQEIIQFNLTVGANDLINLDTAVFAAGVEVGIALGSEDEPAEEDDKAIDVGSRLVLPDDARQGLRLV